MSSGVRWIAGFRSYNKIRKDIARDNHRRQQHAKRANINNAYKVSRYKFKTSYDEKLASLNLGLTNTDKVLGEIKKQNEFKKEGRRRQSLKDRGEGRAVFGASGVTGGSSIGAQRDLAKTIELNNAMQASIDNERVVRAEAERDAQKLSKAQAENRLKNIDKEIRRQTVANTRSTDIDEKQRFIYLNGRRNPKFFKTVEGPSFQ